MLSLLLDDENSLNNQNIWNIFYHLYLDNKSLELVQSRSKKLYALSISMQTWHDSKYGRFLRMCAQKTLDELRNIWKSYDTSNLSDNEQAFYNQRFKLGIQRAVEMQTEVFSQSAILTGCRSAAPATVHSLLDLPKLFKHFWDRGTTDQDIGPRTQERLANPLFSSLLTDTWSLHYGTDPLLGFHLATAYVPLISGSPLYHSPSKKSHPSKVVESARVEFRAWSEHFRKRACHNLTLRYFSGDALAFCCTLQHMNATGDNFANWYRRQYSLEPLVLDGQDYATNGNAPLTFNVIDTSNLTDHLGALSVLMAASPLLDSSQSATMKMESLVRQDKDHQALIDRLVCGHFATISILIGLFPVEYWTNATATSNAEEELLYKTAGFQGKEQSNRGQMYSKITWKRPSSTPPGLHFDETELAAMLYGVYLNMFQHEDVGKMLANMDIMMLRNNSRPQYHRGTLAAFLLFVKRRVLVANWDRAMDAFLILIESDRNLMLGSNHLQELYLQLHLFSVHSVHALRQPCKAVNPTSGWKCISAWESIPAAACVTLKVPRTRLKVFTDQPLKELLTPPVHCFLKSPPSTSLASGWHNLFASVQLSFGAIATFGSRDKSDFRIEVIEDTRGWNGNSPLLISFYAPSWTILQEAQATVVGFGIQNTPQTAMKYPKILGVDMSVYDTTLGNEENVFITRHGPNQKGYPSICSRSDSETAKIKASSEVARLIMRASFDQTRGQIMAMTGRLDIIAADFKSALKDGCQVKTSHPSPCIIAVVLEGKKELQIHYPAPVRQAGSKCRIARKSSYVEVEACLSHPVGDGGLSHFISPTYKNGQDPALWNMPRLNLDRLPIIDTAKTKELQWLVTHVSLMWSSRERKLREQSSSPDAVQKDVRVNFKESLFSQFIHYTGLQGQKAKIFGINSPKTEGVQMIFFVSALRLDIANRTVILDAVVLPLTTQLVPTITTFLGPLSSSGMCLIHVDEDELRLWKEMLPAYVERCRQWKHRPTCEYLSHSQIPVSFKTGERIICSCGNGSVPKGAFPDIPHWNTVAKHTVRVAISPLFSPPFVEPPYALPDDMRRK